MRLKCILGAMLLLLIIGQSASALSYSPPCAVFENKSTDWNPPVTRYVSQFDPSLGVLDSVTLKAKACASQYYLLDSEEETEQNWTVTSTADLSTPLPGTSPLVLSLDLGDREFSLPPDENSNSLIPDMGGIDSYSFLVNECTEEYVVEITDSTALDAWKGLATVSFTTSATGTADVTGPGNYDQSVRTTANATICVTYEYHLLSISGKKVNDCTDAGIDGWEIILKKNGAQVDSKTTAADGTYSFTGLSPGTYEVCETLPTGWTAIGDTCKSVNLTASDVSGVDFRNKPRLLITCPPAVTIECPESLDPAVNTNLGTATATVTGGTATVTYSDSASGTCPTIVTRTWTATYGNCTESCTQTITVNDTVAPNLPALPVGSNLGCNPAVLPSCTNGLVAIDTCDGNVPVSCVPGEVTGESCDKEQIFTYSATDTCGNTASGTVTYTWKEDRIAPVLSGTPTENPTVQCYTEVPVAASVTALDDCDGAIEVKFTETESNPGSSCKNVITRIWTATDECGNVASYTQTITVDDTTVPVNVVPAGGDLGCNPATLPTIESVKSEVSATDNCGPVTPVVTVAEDSITGCTVTRVFTITTTDACGNVDTDTVTYTWTADSEPPVNTVPAGGDLGCNPATLPTKEDIAATAADNCGEVIPVVSDGVTAGDGCDKTLTFTVTSTDGCGLTDTDTVVYTYKIDTEPPVNTVPAGGDLGCNPETLPTIDSVTALVSATDNCGPVTPVVTVADDLITGCTASRVFTVTTTDACGNKDIDTVTYTWTADSEAPVNVVPAGGDLGCNPETLPIIESVTSEVSATDNCGPVTPVVTVAEDSITGCTVSRVFTVTTTDACGNVDTDTVTYTWKEDTEAPAFTPPEGGELPCNTPPVCADIIANDNCDGQIPVDCIPGEITYVGCIATQPFTYSATDACGNTASGTVTYTWTEDTEPPEINCLPDQDFTHLAELNAYLAAHPYCGDVTASDNCDLNPEVECTGETDNGLSGCDEPRVIIRAYKATDDCGNWAECTQTITLQAQTPDCTITVSADPVFQGSTDNTASVVPTDGATYSWTVTGGTITNGQGTPTITWTAGTAGEATISVTVTSAEGCTSTCYETVTIEEGQMTCETAMANWGMDDPNYPDVGTPGHVSDGFLKNARWGWYTVVDRSQLLGGGITSDVWAAAGQNDLSKGYRVGTVTISVDDSGYLDWDMVFDGEYSCNDGDTHVYVSNKKNTKNGFGHWFQHPQQISLNPGKVYIAFHDGDVCCNFNN